MQATVATTLQASRTHIDPGSGTCGFVDVNGSSPQTIQIATPTPIVLEAQRPTTKRSAWWPFFHGFGTDLAMTPGQLQRRLAHGHVLVIHGSDEHFFLGDEGNVLQDSAWTFRLVRAR